MRKNNLTNTLKQAINTHLYKQTTCLNTDKQPQTLSFSSKKAKSFERNLKKIATIRVRREAPNAPEIDEKSARTVQKYSIYCENMHLTKKNNVKKCKNMQQNVFKHATITCVR
jgi:hypothetical protein